MGACKSSQKPEAAKAQDKKESAAEARVTPNISSAATASSGLSRLEQQNSLLDPLRQSGSGSSASDVWLQASFLLQLRRLLAEHPYLEPGRSAQPHPLQNWVDRCRESFESKRFGQAQEHLMRIRAGLKAESRPIAETFRRFDVDTSGHLDDEEFANLCAYLGWDEEKTEQMDLDKDGKVTVQDMEAFVGYMGGVQQFFEKRRLRITRSRKDVCDYSGISVGARVRAFFYVRGQKSSTWRDAVVREVGVARSSFDEAGPATLGASLEFSFASNARLQRWRVKQVVPMSWIIGVVEDASVAASLRDVGILDDQQCFWAVLLPDSEMHAMRELESNQRAALALVRNQASESHRAALAGARERFKKLGYGERELLSVMGWVQDLAPIIVHVDLDRCGRHLEMDDFYRSAFEPWQGGASGGEGPGSDCENERRREHDLFDGLYDDAKPFERVKYGALNVMNDYKGVKAAAKGGDSYLVLKDVRLRSTFASKDGAGGDKRLGVLDKCMHVLEEYSDAELKSLVSVATAAIASAKVGGLATSGHAELKLLRGPTQDPTRDWVTLGFPGLEEGTGKYYFEVVLQEGCCAPQVGLLSSRFAPAPQKPSAQGVGDDEFGWAVDGQHAAVWHHGCTKAWEVRWPSSNGTLAERVVVGLAIDFDKREVLASTNGSWSEAPVFGPEDLPAGLKLYPAVSLKGRAEFVFGPGFLHAPPQGGGFVQWPRTMGGLVKVDCPELGSSDSVSGYKEVQVHGELSLKRNVQRLVASSKYREKPKTKRSYALSVSGAAHCSGSYRREGAHADMPLYKSGAGGVIYWDPEASLWKMNDTEDFTKFVLSAAPVKGGTDVPREGWRVPDEWHGVVEAEAFQAALSKNGVGAADAERLQSALTVGGDTVYRVVGKTSLDQEWERIKKPKNKLTADTIWERAIKELQQKCLKEAGLPADTNVVETDHPYEAIRRDWKRTVKIKDAKGLAVHFASKTCTKDARTTFTALAGGLQRESAGKGARVELTAPQGGGQVAGTLEDQKVVPGSGLTWQVRLDRSKPEPAVGEDGFQPAVGDAVEAQYKDLTWCKAKVADILYQMDWYTGERGPSLYVVDWLEEDLGDSEDRDKKPEQIRRQRSSVPTGLGLEGLARYRMVPEDGASACYAFCAESPKAAAVAYPGGKAAKGATVGDEVLAFKLDRSQPFTPISVGEFGTKGPAQKEGVKVGWFLDLPGTVLGVSRKEFAQLLAGMAGDVGAPPEGEQDVSDRRMHQLLDAAFRDLPALLSLLNGQLRTLSGVTLVFSNSASSQKAKLLPIAHAVYEGGQRVASEVRMFEVRQPGKKVMVESFLKWGPAQQAGVRTDWQVDIAKTRELNPGHADVLSDEVVLGNPNTLLALSNLTLVFKQPSLEKTEKFKGSGPASSEKWKCPELPGNCADFTFATDGDSAGDKEKRWGVWAVVLDKAKPAPSVQTLDALAERWVSATSKATPMRIKPTVEREGWDEARLRSLCERHGWEFEWMAEDGERRRRAHERQGFLQASQGLSGGAEAAAAAEAAIVARGLSEAAREADGTAGDPGTALDGNAASGEKAAPNSVSLRLMTFNVEEYYHGKTQHTTLHETVLKNLVGIRTIVKEHSPDILCLQEHSLGGKRDFGEQDIVNALLEGMDYGYVSYPTGENPGWYSALANAVLWKKGSFELVRSWRVELANAKDFIPGTRKNFTPRAGTCAELKHTGTGKNLVVCATHLMGGRFEDKSFVAEAMYDRCVRAEQVEKLAASIRQTCGSAVPSVIAGDFNVMRHGYRQGSPFRQGNEDYFHKLLVKEAFEMAHPPSDNVVMRREDCTYDGFYVPAMTKVHQVLDRKLGYVCAYGRDDDQAAMQTTLYSGCIDWVYVRNLLPMRDEEVIEVLKHGFSDHNAVTVTLQLR